MATSFIARHVFLANLISKRLFPSNRDRGRPRAEEEGLIGDCGRIAQERAAVGVEINEKDAETHENDSRGQADAVDREKRDIHISFPPRQVLGKEEVEEGLAEEDDHEDDSAGRSIEIFRGFPQLDSVESEKGIDEPGDYGPDEDENQDADPHIGGPMRRPIHLMGSIVPAPERVKPKRKRVK
jgi:hypothetical protein